MMQLIRSVRPDAIWVIVFLLLWPPPVHAVADDRLAVIATIGQQDVTMAEVDLLLGRNVQSAELPQQTLDLSLAILAKRRRALETMRKLNLAAAPSAIDRWVESQPRQQPGAVSSDEWFSTHAKLAGVSEYTLRENLAFRLSWKAYLDRHLSDETIVKHFNNQPHRFDGSKFYIERISIAVPVGESKNREVASKRLTALRQELESVERTSGGELLEANDAELIVRQETITGNSPVDPEILDTAVMATPMQWSPLAHSVVGVHLIRVLKVEYGGGKFDEVKEEVRAHVLVFLLDYLARQSEDVLPLRLKTADQ